MLYKLGLAGLVAAAENRAGSHIDDTFCAGTAVGQLDTGPPARFSLSNPVEIEREVFQGQSISLFPQRSGTVGRLLRANYPGCIILLPFGSAIEVIAVIFPAFRPCFARFGPCGILAEHMIPHKNQNSKQHRRQAPALHRRAG